MGAGTDHTTGGTDMWIGSIRLGVRTADRPNAGTDSLVLVDVLRDGVQLGRLRLDYEYEDDLERGAFRYYAYSQLPRHNDQTPQLPPGIGQNPMPYPDFGYEFSHGVHGHLTLRLHIYGDDMWIKDNVDLSIKQVRQVATSFDTLAWKQDASWQAEANWSQDVALSTDGSEGVTTWSMAA